MDDSLDSSLRLPPQSPVGSLTWIAGGSVDACSVRLRFFGKDLDPDEITQLLGVEPTVSYRKGDILRGKQYDIVQKIGSWRLAIEKSVDVELEDQINELLDRLPPDLNIWQDLTKRFEADLFCGLWMERWNRCLDFAPQTLLRIGERGLRLDLDIYAENINTQEETILH
jgi:Domain of unknown function (DUF4279)